MNKFVCPNCSQISYTADTSQSQKCPNCIEKHIIVNSEMIELLASHSSWNLKLTVNRRQGDRRAVSLQTTTNKRLGERRTSSTTPIGWLAIKHASMAT